jgi:hypothetical protein
VSESPWKVIHGDCLEVLPALPEKSATHIITDPPYHPRVLKNARGLRARGGICARDFGYDSLTADVMKRASAEFGRICDRWCLVFSDAESAPRWATQLAKHGIRPVRIGAWIRLNAAPQFTGDRPAVGYEACAIGHAPGRSWWRGGGSPALWHHSIVNGNSSDRNHPTPKPLPLMLELVEQFTDPGDLVLDPFCGSGTTGVACLRLGRRFIGIEKDAGFARIATERLEAEGQGLTLRAARAGQMPLFAKAVP